MNSISRIALAAALLASPAAAQTPARLGITSTTSPEVLSVMDHTGAWAGMGTVDLNHAFTGYGAGTDVRALGCHADGTDQTSCINKALSQAPDCVIIPATPNGFYVAGTLTVTHCLRGTVWNPSAATLSFAGTSHIRCNNQLAQPCLVANGSGNLSAQVENITLLGTNGGDATAVPVDGSMGFQWQGGFNLILTNVQSANFGSCAYFGPTASAGGGPISMHSYNAMFSRCHKHYVVSDGIPELYFTGGRWGENGGHDYPSADDFFYGTKTTDSGGGGGPNSIVIDTVQINPGNQTVGCPFRWGGFQFTNGAFSANKIINSHVEILDGGYTGTAPTGILCIDNTVPKFPGLYIANSALTVDLIDGHSHPTFNIDPATLFNADLNVSGSLLCGDPSTLTINGAAGGHRPWFDGDYICQTQSFAAGNSLAGLNLSNNVMGNYAISGQWGSLVLNGNVGTLTDTATGSVFESNQGILRPWTPSLTFGANGSGVGGGSVGMTYAVQTGNWLRTATGGATAQALITLTNKGTSTGQAHIENLPFDCPQLLAASIPVVLQNMTGLTGAVTFIQAASNNFAYITQQSATSNNASNLSDANFTNTSTIQVNINCGRVQ